VQTLLELCFEFFKLRSHPPPYGMAQYHKFAVLLPATDMRETKEVK
jgi:hypothetical protein